MLLENGQNISQRQKIYSLLLAALLIFCAFIYLYDLGRESLVTDEYFSFYIARQPLGEIIFGHQNPSSPNTIPPLYEIILHFWLKIFGMSEFAQRSLSAVLGIISVYLIYRLSKLLFDIHTGLISGLFASLSFSWFTFFRQNRCYSLFICLTLLSFYLFFYLLKNKKSRFTLPFWIITNIALAYTNYFAFLVIACQVVLGLFETKGNIAQFKKILLMCLWVAFAYGPWYGNLFYDIKKEPLLNIRIYNPGAFVRLFAIFVTFFADFHIRWEPLLLLLYLPFMARGWRGLHKEKKSGLRFLSLFLPIFYVVSFAIIYSLTSSYRIRYYSAFSFPLFILLALGMQKIRLGKFTKIIFLLLCAVILTLNIADFRDAFTHALNEEWKYAARYIKQVPGYKDKNMIFLFQTKYNPPVFSYYYWDTQVADNYMKNITGYQNYEDSPEHKVYLLSEDIKNKKLFEKIECLPDDAWIWFFRYHESLAYFYLNINNADRYFLRQIPLNPEAPQIDLFLLKRIKK